MSRDGYLPPGVETWMIPGNRPQDEEWEELLEAIAEDAENLVANAKNRLNDSRYFDDCSASELIQEVLAWYEIEIPQSSWGCKCNEAG